MKITKKAKREAKRLYRYCLPNGLLDESRARQVVQRVVATGGRNCLPILMHFLRLVELDRTQHTATVESATPLPTDLQTTVQTELEHRYGRGFITVFAQRPELIGGMRVQVGCDVYDGSVLAGLEALKKSF
ncbi:MAG: F0F1 ATP synthase subunit delta [Candidatus Acidiferrum sp.]